MIFERPAMKTIVATLSIILFINTNAQFKNDRILFVEFEYVNGKPKIINMKTTGGKLKTGKQTNKIEQDLYFEALTKEKELLYTSTINDPTKTVYEYAGENGEIKSTTVQSDNKIFFIRLPYNEAVNKLVIYKTNAEDKLNKTAQSSSRNKFEFLINHAEIKKD